MADKRNWYYRQLVTEANLDEAFDLMELADQNYAVDNGLIGVYRGLDVAEAGVPNLTVQISAGAAYDQTGQRIVVPSTQILNVAVDSLAVSTTVAGGGNSKIISIFAKFKRALSNVKVDGNGVNVMYDVDESFEFIVRQSTEGVAPSPSALDSDEILLCDITRVFGDTAVVDSMIATTRREWAISATNGAYEVRTGQTEAAIQAVLDVAGNHIVAAVGAHAASAISYAGGGAWADGTTNPATTVELQLDKVVSELTAGTGAAKIGSAATGDVAATTVQGAIAELASEKGNKGTTNTWTAVNTFTDSMVVSSASGAKTVTHKLLSATAASETSRHFEVYTTGTPSVLQLDLLIPDEHITFYEICVGICEQADITAAQGALLTGAFRRTGGVVAMIGNVEVSSHGTQGGALSLTLDGGWPALFLSVPGADAMNIRAVVRAHSVKTGA